MLELRGTIDGGDDQLKITATGEHVRSCRFFVTFDEEIEGMCNFMGKRVRVVIEEEPEPETWRDRPSCL
jgi:hypothetical protein